MLYRELHIISTNVVTINAQFTVNNLSQTFLAPTELRIISVDVLNIKIQQDKSFLMLSLHKHYSYIDLISRYL